VREGVDGLERLNNNSLEELAFDAIAIQSDPKMQIDWKLLHKILHELMSNKDYTSIVQAHYSRHRNHCRR